MDKHTEIHLEMLEAMCSFPERPLTEETLESRIERCHSGYAILSIQSFWWFKISIKSVTDKCRMSEAVGVSSVFKGEESKTFTFKSEKQVWLHSEGKFLTAEGLTFPKCLEKCLQRDWIAE